MACRYDNDQITFDGQLQIGHKSTGVGHSGIVDGGRARYSTGGSIGVVLGKNIIGPSHRQQSGIEPHIDLQWLRGTVASG